MLKNYLVVALRNLLKHKLYSFINISGLAIGLASCIIILVFIKDELSYDKFHSKADNIYRVVTDMKVGGVENALSVTSFPTAPALKKDYPEVKEAARMVNWSSPVITYGEKKFKETKFLWADNSLFSIFDIEFIRGSWDNALKNPNEVILTESAALKYFGNDDPVGKILLHDNQIELMVTGVVKDMPLNSHFSFDFLGSFPTLVNLTGQHYMESWHAFFRIYTYIVLPSGYNYKEFENKLTRFVDTHMQDDDAKALGRTYSLSLQPLTDIHLYSDRKAEIGINGSMDQVYIVSVIALFILLIACINFTNLSTARSIKRAGEVGLRKVLGAGKKQLVFQFIGEAFISSLVAVPLALGAAELFLPFFNSLADKNLEINFLSNLNYIGTALFFVIVISLFAGAYPAFFLSRFKPVVIMKGGSQVTSSRSGSFVRRGLIILQFSISIILIICTSIVFSQLDFIKNKKLGLADSQVIVLPANDIVVQQKYDVFKSALLRNSMVESVASSSYMPGVLILSTPFKKEAASDNEKYELTTLPVDYDFFKTLGIHIIAGRSYSRDITTDTTSAFVINESAAKLFGWTPEEALGKTIEWDGIDSEIKPKVIGVTADFHFQSLHNKITPLIFVPKNLWPIPSGFISVRGRTGDMASLIPLLQEEWEKMFSHIPFEYSFLDDSFAGFYKKEEKTSKVFTVFASLAIFIACLGLFGLSAYLVETKTKEIGIRKVLGSSVAGIVRLLSTEFMILISLANFIAWPVAYYFMQSWLEDFAYKVEINYMLFIMAGVTALLIALITVSYHSIKAANKNPVKALKYE